MGLNLEIAEDDKEIISKIAGAIEKSNTAFITMHARPDGDAIGGALALYHILKKLGLYVEIISPCTLSNEYNFLKGIGVISTSIPSGKKDIGFVIDCSDTKRLERVAGLLNCAMTIINIDHHQFNHGFGDINYIKPESSSVCELIFNIALHMDIDFDYDLALYLYIGIVTDTNRFQEGNTNPRSHLIAAYLIDKFIVPVEVSSLIYGSCEINALRLLSKAIESFALSASKKIGYITVTPEMLNATGTDTEDLEGVVNFARNIRGVEVGILFRKIPELNGIKVSLRAKGNVDVSEIAGQFGGGGHHNAAGCLVQGGFEEVRKKILDAVEEKLKFKNQNAK